jgi:hypothetical protein
MQQQMWTEQNVLKIDMEGVVCDVEQCAVEKLWMSSVWHGEQEGMCTGYRYGTACCDVLQSTV